MPRIGNAHECRHSLLLSTLQLTIFSDEELTNFFALLLLTSSLCCHCILYHPHNLINTLFSLLPDYSHLSEHKVVFHSILICISLLIDNVEHLVIYFVKCISSLEKYPLKYFTYFFIQVELWSEDVFRNLMHILCVLIRIKYWSLTTGQHAKKKKLKNSQP